MVQTPPPILPSPQSDTGDRLDSWKEIASYLRREVRTVQRWEKTEGLPVRRHQHDKLASVFAFKSELDAWRQARQSLVNEIDRPEGPEPDDDPAPVEDPPLASDKLEAFPLSVPPPAPQPRRTRSSFQAAAAICVLVAAGYGAWKFFTPTHVPKKTRLVVLPFRCLSDDPTQSTFCEGLTQAMTTQLGHLDPAHLGIIAPQTAFLIKDKPLDKIGSELGVQYVLEGSVARSNNQVRIDAQLIQVSDQTLQRAISLSHDVGDILTLQNEVAQAIANDISLSLSPAEQARLDATRKVDPEAYEAYLHGLVAWNSRSPQGLVKSIDYFNDAIAKSPDFALAYAGLADAYSIASAVPTNAMEPRDVMPKANAAAQHALHLDPKSAEAHAALALVNQSFDWNFQSAEQEYQRALAINPSYGSARQWHALLLMALGRHDEAVAEIERARTLDPLSSVIDSSRIQAYYFARQYDRAIDEARKALEVEPTMLLIYYHLGQSLVQKGNYADAIAVLSKAGKASGDASVFVMALGHANALAGNRAEAGKAIAELAARAQKNYVPALYTAAIYTGLGDRDNAMKWLEKAFEERTEYLIFFNVEPMADPLRSDPRFQDLLHRIGLK
jgi:TolB-like protein/Flp pilus assembly protein TadD